MQSAFVRNQIVLAPPNPADRFTPEDRANGTLVMNWVDPPPMTLSLDFLSQRYQVWANDSTPSLAGLVGYYQVKG